jgi:hypothetical protein
MPDSRVEPDRGRPEMKWKRRLEAGEVDIIWTGLLPAEAG